MTRVLLVGYDPETVDFSDPALPPGMSAEKVRAGIAAALKQFAERGWEADIGFIRPDETAGPTVERQLASKTYDCVVIGAGVRLREVGLRVRGTGRDAFVYLALYALFAPVVVWISTTAEFQRTYPFFEPRAAIHCRTWASSLALSGIMLVKGVHAAAIHG